MTVIYADGRRYELPDGEFTLAELVAALNEQHPGTVVAKDGKVYFPRMTVRVEVLDRSARER